MIDLSVPIKGYDLEVIANFFNVTRDEVVSAITIGGAMTFRDVYIYTKSRKEDQGKELKNESRL